MNWKLIGLWVVLADFGAASAYALWQHGYVRIFELLFANTATTLAFVDLTIALSLIMIWMVGDARQRRIGIVPYLVATLFAGSVGPLLYLIRRERSAGAQTAAMPAGGQRVPA
jgi:hypothetical protein